MGRLHCNLLNLDFAAEISGNNGTPVKSSHEVYCFSTSHHAQFFFMEPNSIPNCGSVRVSAMRFGISVPTNP
jgi:hypothetical protein